MSTVSATNLKNASSGSNNIVLNTDGSIAGACLTQTCRAWVNFNGTGVVAIRASYNVSSITDNGTGDYTVNFTAAMADANYAANVSVGRFAGGNAVIGVSPEVAASTTTAMRLRTFDIAGAANDPGTCSVAIFR